MMNPANLTVTTPSDREIALTRSFNAPRALVFDALTRPELVRRWLTGPPGWTMPVCEIELKVGGSFRYVWRHADGPEMGMRGVFREIVPARRIVHSELFDEPWHPGDALVTTVLAERDRTTEITMTILYDSREIRDAVLKSPMKEGMAMGYDKLEALLASLPAAPAPEPVSKPVR